MGVSQSEFEEHEKYWANGGVSVIKDCGTPMYTIVCQKCKKYPKCR